MNLSFSESSLVFAARHDALNERIAKAVAYAKSSNFDADFEKMPMKELVGTGWNGSIRDRDRDRAKKDALRIIEQGGFYPSWQYDTSDNPDYHSFLLAVAAGWLDTKGGLSDGYLINERGITALQDDGQGVPTVLHARPERKGASSKQYSVVSRVQDGERFLDIADWYLSPYGGKTDATPLSVEGARELRDYLNKWLGEVES